MDMTLDIYIQKLLELKEEHGGDVLIVHKDDNYELKDNMTAMCKYKVLNVSYMKKETKTFVDDFDGTRYNCDVYTKCNKNDKKSIKVLKI